MNWTDILGIGLVAILLVAILLRRGKTGGSCCSNEGIDDDGYSINRREAADEKENSGAGADVSRR